MRGRSHHPTRCGRKMGILLVFLVLVLSSAAFAAGPLPGESARPWRPATSSRSVEELRAPRGDVRTPAPSEEAVKARLAEDYGTFPLLFEQSTPTEDSPVHFTVRGRDKTLYFTPEGITFSLSMPETEAPAEKASASAAPSGPSREDRVGALRAEAPRERWTLKLDFVGAAPVRPEGETKANTVISYFKGKSSEHRTVPTYRRIVYRNLWPGIDLQYAGDMNHLKYQFVVHPGADPAHIRLAYRGAERLAPGSDGGLEIVTAAGTLRDETPVSWQEVDGARVPVTVTYALGEGANPRNYGFAVAPYDRTKPLIIDPVVFIYCGYIGGAESDWGDGIAVDGAGCAYVVGQTYSTQDSFPVKIGPDLTHNGGYADAFVAKVAADGKSLVYCGYIGGAKDDFGNGIAVDGAGNAYVAGSTGSTEATFPVKGGPDLTYNSDKYHAGDAFVAKVAADGTELVYCGYIGGAGWDEGYGIAVDGAGCAYVVGQTYSTQDSFPVKIGPDLTHNGGYVDAFVAKVAADGKSLVYCGYIGGAGRERGSGIAVDGAGCAYVTGQTISTETTFPVKVGPDLTYNGGTADYSGGDVFVAKVAADGKSLAYCGYIGGDDNDYGDGIAVDGAGNAYVAGWTYSTEATFPVKVGPDLTHNGYDGYQDAFVAKVAADGTELVYCGYIGGEEDDWGSCIAVDGAGNAYVTGVTESTEVTFPVKVGPDLTYNGGYNGDAFVAKVAADGKSLAYCGYIGGIDDDYGYGMAVDGAGCAYVVGQTYSTQDSFPVKIGPDLTHNGGYDAFVAKIAVMGPDPAPLTCQATLQGHGAGQHAASLALRLRPVAGGDTETTAVSSDADGNFAVSPSDEGEWRIAAKERRTLSTVRTGTPGGAAVDFGALRAGDANNDDQVTILDFSILASTFGKGAGAVGYDDRADFNGDGTISIVDFSLLASNFGAVGEALGLFGAPEGSASVPLPATSASTPPTAESSQGGCALGAETALPLLLLPAALLLLRGKL